MDKNTLKLRFTRTGRKMKELNHKILKNSLQQLPEYAPPPAIWDALEENLDADATLNAGKANIVAGMQASSSPSAPGDYPGVDSGAYVGSIATQREGLEGQVYTALDNPPYPIFLEYGTSRMLPRPAFSPASVEMRKVLDEELSKVGGRLG